MSDWYQERYAGDAMGHIPLFPDRDRDEDRLPLAFLPPDRVYFHMQEKKIRVAFKGVEQPESFDSWAGADAFLATLQRTAP